MGKSANFLNQYALFLFGKMDYWSSTHVTCIGRWTVTWLQCEGSSGQLYQSSTRSGQLNLILCKKEIK